MKRILLYILLICFYTNISANGSESWKENNYWLCWSIDKKPQFFLFFPPDKKIVTFVPFKQDYGQKLLEIIVNDEKNLIVKQGDPIEGPGFKLHLDKNTKKLGWTIKQKNEEALPALILECDYKP